MVNVGILVAVSMDPTHALIGNHPYDNHPASWGQTMLIMYVMKCMPLPMKIVGRWNFKKLLERWKNALQWNKYIFSNSWLMKRTSVCWLSWWFNYFWFKYDSRQKYYAPQVWPNQGSNSWPPDHDSTFHVTETPAVTTQPSVNVNVNANVSVYSLKSPLSSADFTIYAPDILYSLISSGENSAFAHFAAAIANHYNFSFLVPPGTHHCWVDRASVIWEAYPWPTPLHMTGHVLPLCENCGQTTLPCLQYPTSSVVYAKSTRAAPH